MLGIYTLTGTRHVDRNIVPMQAQEHHSTLFFKVPQQVPSIQLLGSAERLIRGPRQYPLSQQQHHPLRQVQAKQPQQAGLYKQQEQQQRQKQQQGLFSKYQNSSCKYIYCSTDITIFVTTNFVLTIMFERRGNN